MDLKGNVFVHCSCGMIHKLKVTIDCDEKGEMFIYSVKSEDLLEDEVTGFINPKLSLLDQIQQKKNLLEMVKAKRKQWKGPEKDEKLN